MHQHQEKRAQQQLVRYRVKILAQHGALLEDACQGAIQRVGQPGGQKHVETQRIAIFQDGYDQERSHADARQREQVGCVAEWVQTRARNVGHERINLQQT